MYRFLIGNQTKQNHGKVLINLDHISCVMEYTLNADTVLEEKKACIVLQGGAFVYLEESYDEVVNSLNRSCNTPTFRSD